MTTAMVHQWADVAATVYYADKGEIVAPRHNHGDYEHTTACLAGRSLVSIFDGRPARIMSPADGSIALPGHIDHEVSALEDGTIVMHMMSTIGYPAGYPAAARAADPKDGEHGGVIFANAS